MDFKIPYCSLQVSHKDFSGIFSNEEEAFMLSEELEPIIILGNSIVEPCGMIVFFDNVVIGVDSVIVNDVTFECGKKIATLLKGSQSIALFVCTIGGGVSNLYKQFNAIGELLNAYFVDALGSIAVEKTMDVMQLQIADELMKKNLKITNRFSPGYCNWWVGEQKKLFSLLPSNPCNIHLSESSLMTPSKSISGILGIGKSVRYIEHNCSLCGMTDCLYRNKLH